MKIFWLIDIFDEEKSVIERMALAIKGLGIKRGDKVQATYIASPAESRLSLAFDVPKNQRFTEYPHKVLSQKLADAKSMEIPVQPTILVEKANSLKAMAEHVGTVVKKGRFDLIALQTHGRKGFQRLVLGSFAETLVHCAKTSLLILSPSAQPTGAYKKIMFATDLSNDARKGAALAAKIAKRSGGSLLIFHVPSPSYWLRFEQQEAVVAKYQKDVPRQLEVLASAARRLGVRAEVMIAPEEILPITDSIIKTAQVQNVDLIMVQARSGRLGTLFLGSVTLSLIRGSQVPVLVIKS